MVRAGMSERGGHERAGMSERGAATSPPDIRCLRVSEAEAALAKSGFALGDVDVTEPPRERRRREGRFWETDGGAYCYRVVRWSLRQSQEPTVDILAARVPDEPMQ